MESMARDKKFAAGQIRFVLTRSLGSAFLSDEGEITRDDVLRAIAVLRGSV
jgi:3-dehydroquinate synthetase